MKLDDAFKCRWRLLRQLEAWWFLRNQRTEKRHDFFIRQFNQKQQLGGGIPLSEWLINGLPNYTWDNSSNWGHQRLCISASPPGRRSPQLRHSFAIASPWLMLQAGQWRFQPFQLWPAVTRMTVDLDSSLPRKFRDLFSNFAQIRNCPSLFHSIQSIQLNYPYILTYYWE